MSWKEIKVKKDVEELNNIFGNFHDAYLKEVCFSSGSYVNNDLSMHEVNNPIARFLFQRAWKNPAAIEIQFEDVIQINIKPGNKNEFSDIIVAHLYFEDGIYFWSAKDYEYIEEGKDDYTWIAAKKVKWRICDEYLGKKIIYMKSQEIS